MYLAMLLSIVEPPNKGHVGDNINSAVVSFVERLSSFGGSKCIRTIGKQIFVERSIILCPYLGGSTIGGSTVHTVACLILTFLSAAKMSSTLTAGSKS